MSYYPCPKCGFPLVGNEYRCPECGVQLSWTDESEPDVPSDPADVNPELQPDFQPQPGQVYYVVVKTNWAQYFYECGVITWETVKKFVSFRGRASRREFWSYLFIGNPILFGLCGFIATILTVIGFAIGETFGRLVVGIASLTFLVPFLMMLGVTIRRYHDTNHSGWWCIIPVACFFLLFKESDKGSNDYGPAEPAEDML